MRYEKVEEIAKMKGVARIDIMSQSNNQCKLKITFEPKVFCALPIHWDFLCLLIGRPGFKGLYRNANGIHCMDMYEKEPVTGRCSDSMPFNEYIDLKKLNSEWSDYASKVRTKKRIAV